MLNISKNPKLHETKSFSKSLNSKPIQEVKSGFLNYRKVEFDAGHSLGYPSSWSLFLISCGSKKPNNQTRVTYDADNCDYCALFLDHFEESSDAETLANTIELEDRNLVEFVVRNKIEILSGNGNVLTSRDIETSPRDKFSTGFWGWRKISPLQFDESNDLVESNNQENDTKGKALELRITFSIIGRLKDTLVKIPSSCVNFLAQEQDKDKEIAMAFYNLVLQGLTDPDVIIESALGKQYFVHKDILAARSPVFRAMFKTSMTEGSTGKAVIEDISPKAMDYILRHIYTGQVETEWLNCPKIATELVNAADKYWLNTLMNFCDKNLVRAATEKNCLQLLELASLHDLDCALDDLTTYVKKRMTPPSDSLKGSGQMISHG